MNWFSAKNYGWGWRPSTWQGWLSVIVWICVSIADFAFIDRYSHSMSDTLTVVVPHFLVFTLALIGVCWLKGERPYWKWAGKPVSARYALQETAVLLGFIVGTNIVGAIGALFTAPNITTWYVHLVKPEWNPPSWIFGIVWPILYALMGCAAYIVWYRRKEDERSSGLIIFYCIHLVLNVFWSYIFFSAHDISLAFSEIILLWFIILAMTFLFWRVSRWAGVLLLPYIAWVSFAVFLNFTFWHLNAGF